MTPYPWQELKRRPIIGVDEVGRGCLAGAVYAAAVILDETHPCDHFTDSKTISEIRREELSAIIHQTHRVCVAFATVEEILELNIFRASLLAMRRAVLALGVTTGSVLVDGKFKIPDLPEYHQIPLIKGDLRAKPVAAASIAAKVARDREMVELSKRYPGYGFDRHKGYSTRAHKQAIQKFGVLPIHRAAFAGVKEFL